VNPGSDIRSETAKSLPESKIVSSMRSIGSSNVQAPRYRETPSFKDQISEDFSFWILMIEDCELFASCHLVIGDSAATQRWGIARGSRQRESQINDGHPESNRRGQNPAYRFVLNETRLVASAIIEVFDFSQNGHTAQKAE
jgi:hypothetical protein